MSYFNFLTLTVTLVSQVYSKNYNFLVALFDKMSLSTPPPLHTPLENAPFVKFKVNKLGGSIVNCQLVFETEDVSMLYF